MSVLPIRILLVKFDSWHCCQQQQATCMEVNQEVRGQIIGKVGNFIGHEHLFNILLHYSGLLADIDAVQELPDVLLPDPGGLLDQGR